MCVRATTRRRDDATTRRAGENRATRARPRTRTRRRGRGTGTARKRREAIAAAGISSGDGTRTRATDARRTRANERRYLMYYMNEKGERVYTLQVRERERREANARLARETTTTLRTRD
jgi:hypothetical protein